MAKNSIDAYGAKGKSNVLMFDPDDLLLVIDRQHPLYDPRVMRPINEALVRNIMHQGVLQTITITKNPETGAVEVVAGRQRVRAAREANRRLREAGLTPIQVPALPRRATDADLVGVMVSENEVREGDTPLGRADKMHRLTVLGKTHDQVAMLFGCSAQTVRGTLLLLDCCSDVRTAVATKQIAVGHARVLAKMPPDQQRTKVAELVAAGMGSKPHERARSQRDAIAVHRPVMRSRREIKGSMATHDDGPWRRALEWVLREGGA